MSEIIAKSNKLVSFSFLKGYSKKPVECSYENEKSNVMVWHMDASITLFVVQKMNPYWFLFWGEGSAISCVCVCVHVCALEEPLVAPTATTAPD